MSNVYSLSEMVDLALATPKIGVVNCFMLHALLHALIKRLKIGECHATIAAKGEKNYPWTELPARTSEFGTETEVIEPNIIVSVSPIPQSDANTKSQDIRRETSPTKNTEAALDKKLSKQDRSKRQTSAPTQDGEDAADSRSMHKEPSVSKKDVSSQDSEILKKKPSSSDRSKSKRIVSPTTSFTRDGDDSHESRGSQKEPSSSKKDTAGRDSENLKKKSSSSDRSKPKRGTSQILPSRQDSDIAKDPQGLQKESSASKKEPPSQDSSSMKKKPSSQGKSKSQHPLDDDSSGSGTADDEIKITPEETSLKSVLESEKETPNDSSLQTTEDQFGLPFLENGVSSLKLHFKDIPKLLKKLSVRLAANENEIKRLKDKTSDGGKSKVDRLNGKVSSLMNSMGKLENAVFGTSPIQMKDDKDLDELKNKVDKMLEMSNDLGDNVLHEIVPEGSSDEALKPAVKRKNKKEPKKSSKKSKKASAKEKTSPVVIKSESDEEILAAVEETHLSSTPPLSSPSSFEEELFPSPPVAEASPAHTTEDEKSQIRQEKESDKQPLSRSISTPQRYDKTEPKHPDVIENLQKKVNRVLQLMENLEKAVKAASVGKEKSVDQGKEKSVDEGKEKYVDEGKEPKEEETEKVMELKSPESKEDQTESAKYKQGQVSYQMLFSRIKKLEDDMQKVHQIVSSDSSSSSNLTKMVGDFLSTISPSAALVPELEPTSKKSRKEKREKRKKKKLAEDQKDKQEKEEKEDKEEKEEKEEKVEEKEDEEQQSEEEASDVEEKPKEPQAKEIQDIVIIQEGEPEKLSDVWNQLKVLADALRGMKSNILSLEKNSKNMAKAMQLLMRGNMNVIDEDFEIIGELKVVVRKLFSDFKNLDAMVKQDRNILLNLTVTVDNLISGLDETKTYFAGKMENLRNSLIQKADRQDVDNIVSSIAKKLNISDYRREMDQLKLDMKNQENNFMMDIQQLKNDKYDRFEMDIFRMWVECKLSATKKIPKANVGEELYQDDGAILKKQIPFHCLSCDKSLLITPQPLIPPRALSTMPPTKQNRLISANEGDSARLLRKRNQITKTVMKPIDKILLEGKDNKLYQGHQKPADDNEKKVKTPDEVTSHPEKKEQLPPLNGAVPSKSEHGLSRRITKRKSSQSQKSIISDEKEKHPETSEPKLESNN